MKTATRTDVPGQCGIDFQGHGGVKPVPPPAKKVAKSAASVEQQEARDGWLWVEGLKYREPAPLKAEGVSPNIPQVSYSYLTGQAGIGKMVSLLNRIADNKAYFGIDYETGPKKTAPVDPETGRFDLSRLAYSTHTDIKRRGSEPHTSVVFLMAVSVRRNHAYVVDVRECLRVAGDAFREALGRAAVEGWMIAHNAAFEWMFTKALTKCPKHPEGVDAQAGFDTMIGTRIAYAGLYDPHLPWTDPAKPPPFQADAEAVLSREMGIHLDKQWQKFFLSLHPETGLTDDLIAYVAGDTALLLELATILKEKLVSQKTYHLWSEFEKPFLPLVARAQYEGVNVDVTKLLEYRTEARGQLAELEVQWTARYPRVNYSSQPQILELFRAKHPTAEITSADEKSLAPLVDMYEDQDAKLLLDLRSVAKVLGTYIEPWINTERNPVTGRIHCRLNQCDTSTSRMSSASPNLQNIPSRPPWNKMRSCFHATEGNLIVDRDLSQFEVRALADMAGETNLLTLYVRDAENNLRIQEFIAARGIDPGLVAGEKWEDILALAPDFQPYLDEKNDCDVHFQVAKACHEGPTPWEHLTPKEKKLKRKEAKPVSFGIPYGVGPRGLAEQAGVSRKRAVAMIEAYKRQYPDNWRYLTSQAWNAMHRNVVYASTGRPRYFTPVPKHFSAEDAERILSGYGRAGMNFPIQGINAEVIKKASVLMAPFLRRCGAEFRLWVHDELVVECPQGNAQAVADHMAVCMKEAAKLCNLNRVPVETSLELGTSWSH